jgi:anti-anti-sigma factor
MVPYAVSRPFTVQRVGAVTVVRFRHVSMLEDAVVAEARACLFDLVEGQGRRLVVLNFGRVTSLASRMLGQLVALHHKLEAAGGRLALCEVSPFLYEVFEAAKLPGLLCVRGGEPEALEALAQPRG